MLPQKHVLITRWPLTFFKLYVTQIVLFVSICSNSPTCRGTFQDPQWMPETVDSTELYIHYVFFPYTHIFSLKRSNLRLLLGIAELPASLFLRFGVILSKIRMTWTHKHCHTRAVNLITKMVTNWLTGLECAQRGDTGQRDS